ncbi:unnamed protein product [Peronospora destructor]|uniref:Methyltransferase-like protein 4 n=1 Tax=Peronospora destructor TaxID=86335 RepID=A0AAV0UYE3_9STRA|nr:unnamed protein product [Peronospora destructor]
MEPKVSCVNHAALVNEYFLGHLYLRKDSLHIPSAAFVRSRSINAPMETWRRQKKRDIAAQRRAQRLEQLIAQSKFVPLSNRVKAALEDAHKRFGGSRFELRTFLPSFEGHTNAESGSTLDDVLNSLSKASEKEVLDDGNVHCNPTDRLQVATVNGTKVLLPAGSSFAQRDVRELCQISLGRHKLIVIDPPWLNKSVSRGKHYDMFDHTQLLTIDIPHVADPDECILGVWVTNRPRYLTYLREQALPSVGLYLPCVLVLAKAKQKRHHPSASLTKTLSLQTTKKSELFARELRPNWTNVGNEVFKFQNASMFQPSAEDLHVRGA